MSLDGCVPTPMSPSGPIPGSIGGYGAPANSPTMARSQSSGLPAMAINPWKPSVAERDWRSIVLHHTASESGSVESIHEAHTRRKDKAGNPWLGIGYHFVIGNGSGMGDGEIEPTFRWREQMHGAHAGDDEHNQHGIGVVLVGNFEKHPPSDAQMASVKRLVATLKAAYGISSSNVIGHGSIKATACPGKYFPLDEISQGNLDRQFSELRPAAIAPELAASQRSRK